MDNISKRLKEAMNLRNMTQSALVAKTNLPKSAICSYLAGKYEPKQKALYLISNALGVSEGWLMGLDVPMQPHNDGLHSPVVTSDTVTFPVIGSIAAGYDEIAVEDWTGDTIELPASYLRGRPASDYFVLSVTGNSMYPLFMDGDKVLILKQSTLNASGDIGAVLYDGDCATLKKVEFVAGEDWLRLVPVNPEYMPKTIRDAELEQCRIIGIPRLLIREM